MADDDDPGEDLDRDVFYAPDDDDDFEYELEPPDPDVLAAEKRHAEQHVARAESHIDVDEMFRSQEQYDHDELLKDFVRGGKFRFRTKHLLVGTALLAVFMAIGEVAGYPVAVVLYFLVGVSAALVYLNRREQRHDAELQRRKRAFKAEMRREQAADAPTEAAPDDAEVAWHDAQEKRAGFRFSFSTAEFLVAFTVAAILMGCISLIGPDNGALTLGLVALVGLAAHAAGFDPPPVVMLGWWLLLLLYVVVSLSAVFWSSVQTSGALELPHLLLT